MLTKEDRKIIEDEINRLETAWENAHEKYGFTGSPSTERTMQKYDTLRNALENYLYKREDSAAERAMIRYQDQLVRVHKKVEDSYRAGRIEPAAYAEIIRILMEG